MPVMKRQKADGTWEYIQTTGLDVSTLSSDVAQVKTDLAEKANLADIVNVPTPDNFGWKNHPLVDKIGKDNRGYFTNYDVSVNEIKGKTYYVDWLNGNNSNDGLTPSTALQSMLTAYNKPDVAVIVMCQTRGLFAYQMNGTPINKSITIKSLYNRKVTLTNHVVGTGGWTKTAGYTSVYQYSSSAGSLVIDINRTDSNGDYFQLTSAASIAACDSAEDTFFIDKANSLVYAHFKGGGGGTSSILIITDDKDALTVDFTNGGSLYLENIDFLGGFSATGNGNIYAKNCKFLFGKYANSCRVSFSNAVFQDCIAAHSLYDGFDYTQSNVVEINCKGYNNGASDRTTSNGSTGHMGAKVVRINGSYHDNYGPNVADVQTDTESWNIACTAYNSKVTNTADYQHSDFQINNDGVAGNVQMFLEGCISYGSTYGVQVQAGTIYIKNNQFTTYRIDSTKGGQILDY